jgi:hypothetical protein
VLGGIHGLGIERRDELCWVADGVKHHLSRLVLVLVLVQAKLVSLGLVLVGLLALLLGAVLAV